MSGTIPLSLSQQLDEFGQPLKGGKLYIIQAGTVSTPQDSFQDPALTIKLPNPITMDAAGRLPQFFIADGLVKIRMTDLAGTIQREADQIQVIGPSSGGSGGGSAVDPNALVQTGNLIARYGIGSFPGYVRCNGNTIGNAGSGSNERANSDTQALWIYLYGVDANLVVSGGRTGNALNDYNASKQLALPDWRGCAIAALDDMGAPAAGRLTSTYFGTSAVALGALGGAQNHTLTVAELPSHTHTGTTGPMDRNQTHAHSYTRRGGVIHQDGTQSATVATQDIGDTTSTANLDHLHPITTDPTGGGSSHSVCQPTKLCTIYMKL